MAGLSILTPIHIHPISPLSSAPFTSITALSPLLWDYELLQPSSFGPRVPSTSLTVPSPAAPDPSACDGHNRLMHVLNLTSEPHANSTMHLVQSVPSHPHKAPANPIPRCLTPPPPPYAMHSPLTSTHKTPFSSMRLRGRPTPTGGKSTMSFKLAAPVPRIPLATVLQYWSAHETPKVATCPDDASCKMNTDEWDCEYVFPESGLGLILGGAAQGSQSQSSMARIHAPLATSSKAFHHHPYSPPAPRSQQRSQSRARHSFSRRLRRLAPAPLQLASATPRRTFRTLLNSAPNARRTPASALFVDVPLTVPASDPVPSDSNLIPDIESESAEPSRTPRHRSAPFSLAAMLFSPFRSSSKGRFKSTTPTSLFFPTAATADSASPRTHAVTHDTNGLSPLPHQQGASASSSAAFVDLLTWRHTVSRALDSTADATPGAGHALGLTLGIEVEGDTEEMDEDAGLAPPPLRRMEWVPLPPVATDGPLPSHTRVHAGLGRPHHTHTDVHGNVHTRERRGGGGGGRGLAGDIGREGVLTRTISGTPDSVSHIPFCADLRLDLDAEDLVLRAEKCAEAIGRASYSLRSCSLLKDPEAIAELCDSLRQTFKTVQRALDGTPTDFVVDGSEAKENWYTKHWELIESLNKNINYFYLLVRPLEDRPPRIHKLAPLLDKLATYRAKFADLARKISLSHEKLRLVNLRGQLATAQGTARGFVHVYDRRGRHEDRATRARQREIREEIRRVRATIRAMRAGHEDEQDENENMQVCEEEQDATAGKRPNNG